MNPTNPTLMSVKTTRYVSLRFQRVFLMLSPKIPCIQGSARFTKNEIHTRTMTVKITKIHPIVGVPAFPLWSFANSVALPMSHSSRICFPILSLVRSLMPDGMIKNVILKDAIRDAKIKKRLFDIENI
jgi:hypothetical protein